IAHFQARDVGGGFNEDHALGGLAHRPFDLRMTAVADHDDFAARRAHLRDLDVHLGDERTGRVEYAQTPRLGLAAHGLRDPVGAEDHRAARGNLAESLDEHGAFALQVLDDVFVVHDLAADVHRSAADPAR